MVDSNCMGGMKVIIWLTTPDHTKLPANFDANYYYQRSSNLSRYAFEGKFKSVNNDFAKEIMELEGINALRWENGELADMVVQLIDSHGEVHFLKKDKVPVQAANR